MDLATLFVRFKADTSDVDKQVKNLEKSTTSSAQTIAKKLAQAFSAAAIGVGIKKTIDAASDLNETVSKTEVIFGNASTAVEKAGDSAAKSMGLSKRAYLDAASSLKGLLDNMGLAQDQSVEWSQKLVQLGSDLGSFFNKDPAEAIAAIQSALRGETEPIRAFNVQISQAAVVQEALREGLIKSAGEMDNNARAQATLALIMQQTTAAQGDFARTSDGAANSQRIMKAEMENAAASIGQNLLPVYTKLVQFVSQVVSVFGSLPGPVQTSVLALVGFVALSGPISTFIEVAGKLREAISAIGAGAPELVALAAIVVALGVAFGGHDDKQKEVAARAREVASNLDKETDSIVKQRGETNTATDATAAYADAQAALSAALTGGDEKGKALAKSLGALGLQAGDAAEVLGNLTAATTHSSNASKSQADEQQRAYDKATQLTAAFLEQHGIASDVAVVLAQAGAEASVMGDAADVTKEKTKGWTDENKQLLAAMIEVGKQAGNTDIAKIAQDYLNAEEASSTFKASLVAQAEAQAGASRNSDQAATVYQNYLQILENLAPAQKAQLDLTDQQAQANEQAASSFSDVDRAAAEYQVRQDQLKARQEANAGATEKLKDALDGTDDKLSDAASAANDLNDALQKLLGGNIDVEEANRKLEAGIDNVTKSIKDNGATLDIQTEKGRNNREAIEDQVKAIQDKITADVASGVAVQDATNAGLLYRQQLIDTAVQSGVSREAAEAYVDQLGLTPENVTTAVQLEHDQEMKDKLTGLLGQLGDIDAGAAAEIQALIDRGAFDEAQRRLDALAATRTVIFVPKSSGDYASPRAGGRSALGRYVPGGTNMISSLGEDPGRSGDEVVLPLGHPGRIRQLLASNGVGSRIFAAVGAASPSGAATTGTDVMSTSSMVDGDTYTMVVNNNGRDVTVDDLSRVIQLARMS